MNEKGYFFFVLCIPIRATAKAGQPERHPHIADRAACQQQCGGNQRLSSNQRYLRRIRIGISTPMALIPIMLNA